MKAKIVLRPEDYPWSSHKAYLGLVNYIWLTREYVLRRFGENAHDATASLLDFISARIDAEADLEQIHAALAAGAYGDEDFVREHVEEPIIPQPSAIISELNIEQLVVKVSKLFGVTPQQLAGSSRQSNVVDARSVLALFAREASNLSLYSVSRALKKNHGTISRLASRAESSSELLNIVKQLLESSHRASLC